ncbi:MAG: CoA transferase subunit A [Bacillus sp. (in: firmicutes)]
MDQMSKKIVEWNQMSALFRDGMSIMVGGFGGVGSPPTLIGHILRAGIKDLTIICNDTGFPGIGIGQLVTEKRVRKLIVSHIGSNPNAGRQMSDGEIEVEFSPQGILMERIRAGGSGIKAFLSGVGSDHDLIKGSKQTVILEEKRYLLETALTADISIVYAKKADPFGNLIYDKSARNTNPLVAKAGHRTIAEVEEIVQLGALSPEEIITPGVYVDHIVQSKGVDWKWAWE